MFNNQSTWFSFQDFLLNPASKQMTRVLLNGRELTCDTCWGGVGWEGEGTWRVGEFIEEKF